MKYKNRCKFCKYFVVDNPQRMVGHCRLDHWVLFPEREACEEYEEYTKEDPDEHNTID